MTSKSAKAYAGVLPWTVDSKGHLRILLGREAGGHEAGKWSDFGGGVEPKDHSSLAAAFREMGEESMGLLAHDESTVCPSLTFDFGGFHGTLVLGVLGDLNTKGRLSKKAWKHLEEIPSILLEKRKALCTSTSHDPSCEKDRAVWIRVKDIVQIEPSLLLLTQDAVLPLRKNYGLLLTKALDLLMALQ